MSEGLGDRIKGGAQEIAGKVQEGVGHATGNADQEAKGDVKQGEGKLNQTKGNVEGAAGDAKRKVENVVDDITR